MQIQLSVCFFEAAVLFCLSLSSWEKDGFCNDDAGVAPDPNSHVVIAREEARRPKQSDESGRKLFFAKNIISNKQPTIKLNAILYN
jgi:hypothetical protein